MTNDEYYANEAAKLELTKDGKVCIPLDDYCDLIEDQRKLNKVASFFGDKEFDDFENECRFYHDDIKIDRKSFSSAVDAIIESQENSSSNVPPFWYPIKGYELKELQQYLVLSFGVPQIARCVFGELVFRDSNGNHFKYDKTENGEYANISSIALIPHTEQSNA